MKEQMLILVDNNDKFLGYAPRTICHTGKGKRHRAFVIAIYNKEKKLLLQKRKHHVFDGLWDLTAASHPLKLKNKVETYNEAGNRCLKTEWNIRANLRKIGSFNYFSKDEEKCENEHCALLIGKLDGNPQANPDHAYDHRWVSLEELLKEVKQSPNRYTPWLMKSIPMLKKKFEKKI